MASTPPRAKTTLREWMNEGPFALAISPGFFGFFAQLGAVQALDATLGPDVDIADQVTSASGCSGSFPRFGTMFSLYASGGCDRAPTGIHASNARCSRRCIWS